MIKVFGFLLLLIFMPFVYITLNHYRRVLYMNYVMKKELMETQQAELRARRVAAEALEFEANNKMLSGLKG